jgi:hypothetical protein
MSKLLALQDYCELPVTTRLIARCRKEIVKARLQLAGQRRLTNQARTELWLLIDNREWFLRMLAKDYKGELEQIDRELEAKLSR